MSSLFNRNISFFKVSLEDSRMLLALILGQFVVEIAFEEVAHIRTYFQKLPLGLVDLWVKSQII